MRIRIRLLLTAAINLRSTAESWKRGRKTAVTLGFNALGFITLLIPFIVTSDLQAQGTAPEVVDRAAAIYGLPISLPDSTSIGKVTFFNLKGPVATFDVTVIRSGRAKVQRTIKEPSGNLRQGSDGLRTWDSFGQFTVTPAQGRAQYFVESQTTRSIEALFDYRTTGLVLRDKGTYKNSRIIEAEDKAGRKTQYGVDPTTFAITQVQMIVGRAQPGNAFNTDTYVLSDYRKVGGILTPFKIVRYITGSKVEEIQYSSVTYGPVLDSAFKP